MGIPGFASRMRDYGSREVIGRHNAADPSALAIIDGPSLAYFIYYNTQGNLECHQGIVSKCDYASLGAAAVAWLNRLETFGFTIEGIYFDGSLPTHKTKVRLERLQRHLANLVRFKQLHDQVHIPTRHVRVAKRRKPTIRITSGTVEQARKVLPPPPFVVFAVVEALLNSSYQNRTLIVPGEADTYCVAAAIQSNESGPSRTPCIFSNDSDLIVYNSGAQTKVILLNSIEVKEDTDGIYKMDAVQFWPSKIAADALPSKACTDLIKPAFLMRDHSMTFKQAISQSNTVAEDDLFSAFRREYDASDACQYLPALRKEAEGAKYRIMLESRFSEVVNAARDLAEDFKASGVLGDIVHDGRSFIRHQSSEDRAVKLTMFLPVLFEDPSRSSAWKFGRPLRSMAASLLLQHYGLTCSVVEYARSGSTVKPQDIDILSSEDLLEHLHQLCEFIEGLETRLEDVKDDRARSGLISMQILSAELIADSTQSLDEQSTRRILDSGEITTWKIAHLDAQFQAEKYCLYLLRQVSALVAGDGMRSDEQSTVFVKACSTILELIPRISPC